MTSEGASTMKTTSMTTLEVLRDARDRLADTDTPYEHERWSSCTCGHIYRAHQGVYGNPVQGPGRLDAAYARVILDVAAALGWDGSRGPGSRFMGDCARVASVYVSDYAIRRARERTLSGIMTAYEDARGRDRRPRRRDQRDRGDGPRRDAGRRRPRRAVPDRHRRARRDPRPDANARP
jgi:hypothetical protein